MQQKNLVTVKYLNFLMIMHILLGMFTLNLYAQSIPADLMRNCHQWKITYPDGMEEKQLCDKNNNEYFYVSDSGDALVFFAPIRSNNGTTANSSYIRSELREREEDGSRDIYWTTAGRHVLYVDQKITHLPIVKSHLVASQIHGNKADGIDDAMVLRLEGNHLFLSFNGGKLRNDLTINTDYVLGVRHEVIFEIVDGKHYCYYSEAGGLLEAFNNENADAYLVKDGGNPVLMNLSYDQTYFKVGNYTQSNADKEGQYTDDSDNYGEVYVYDFLVEHSDISTALASDNQVLQNSLFRLETNNNTLRYELAGSDVIYGLEIYNLSGHLINSVAVTGLSGGVNISSLSAGMYYVILRGQRTMYRQKLFVP